MLEEIINQLEKPDGERQPIPAARVHHWMKTQEAETLGAVYSFLCDGEQVTRVVPPLDFDDVFGFLLRYFEFCLRTNPQGEWVDTRWSAGWGLVRLFVSLWDEGRPENYFSTMKSLLEELYVTGPPELKDCLEHAVIEHLFEREPIRHFFDDWRSNPNLRQAYDEAMLWVRGGGSSPLTEQGPK